MKGSAIIVQFTKECAELFSKFAFNANSDEKKTKKRNKENILDFKFSLRFCESCLNFPILDLEYSKVQ